MAKNPNQIPRSRLILTAKETGLILALRHEFRNGEVVILVRQGLVQRISQTVRSVNLDDVMKKFGLDN